MEKVQFKASYDNSVKIFTALYFIMIILVICWELFPDLRYALTPLNNVTHFIPVMILVLITLIAYGYSANKYMVSEQGLEIHAPFRKIVIPKSEIAEVRLIPNDELHPMVRIFGVGGPFGFNGRYRSARLGTIHMHATRRNDYLLVREKSGKLTIITPDDHSIINHLV